MKKYRHISVDSDIADVLRTKAEELEQQFGFKPTVSQTLRHLLNKGAN